MTMNCPPLLLPPPPVPSIQSHRLLISSARRRETAMIRERWKQNQKKMTSPVRMHPLLVPPDLSASSRSVMSALRKSTTYGRCQDVSTPSSTHKHQQFPFLETEVTKRNLTQRLPYFVPVHVQSAPERDYPTQCTTTVTSSSCPPAGSRHRTALRAARAPGRSASSSTPSGPQRRCPGKRFITDPTRTSSDTAGCESVEGTILRGKPLASQSAAVAGETMAVEAGELDLASREKPPSPPCFGQHGLC